MIQRKIFCTIPLRDVVVYPKITASLMIGRRKSLKALEKAEANNDLIFVVVQKNGSKTEVKQKDLYDVGVLCNILQSIKLPDGTVKLIVMGLSCAKLKKFSDNGEYYFSEIEHVKEGRLDTKKVSEMRKIVLKKFREYVQLNNKLPKEVVNSIEFIKTIEEFVYYIATLISLSSEDKQLLLEENSDYKKLKRIYQLLEIEAGLLQTELKLIMILTKRYLNDKERFF